MTSVSPVFDVSSALAALRDSVTIQPPPGDLICMPSGAATPARLCRPDERPALGELSPPDRSTPLQRYKIQRQKKLQKEKTPVPPISVATHAVPHLKFGPMDFDSPQLREQQVWLANTANAIITPSSTAFRSNVPILTPAFSPAPFQPFTPEAVPPGTPDAPTDQDIMQSVPPTPANPEPAAMETFFRARSAHINSPIFRRKPTEKSSDYVLNTPTVRANPLAVSATTAAQLPDGISCEIVANVEFSLDFGFDRTLSVDLGARAVRVPLPYAIKIHLSDLHGSIRPVSARLEPNRDFSEGVLLDVIGDAINFRNSRHTSDSQDTTDDSIENNEDYTLDSDAHVLMFWAAPDVLAKQGYTKLLIFVIDEDGEEHETELEIFLKGTAPVIQVEAQGKLQCSNRSETNVNFESGQNFSEETVTVWNKTTDGAPLFVNVLLIDSCGGAFSIGMNSEDIRQCIPMIIPADSCRSFTSRFELPADATPGKEEGLYFGNAAIQLARLFRKVADPSHDNDLEHFYDHVVSFHSSRKSSSKPWLSASASENSALESPAGPELPANNETSETVEESRPFQPPSSAIHHREQYTRSPGNVSITTSDAHYSPRSYTEESDEGTDSEGTGSTESREAAFTDYVPIYTPSMENAEERPDDVAQDSTWFDNLFELQDSPKWIDNVQPPLRRLMKLDEDDDVASRGTISPVLNTDEVLSSSPANPTSQRLSSENIASTELSFGTIVENAENTVHSEVGSDENRSELDEIEEQPPVETEIPDEDLTCNQNDETLPYIAYPEANISREKAVLNEAKPKLRMPRSIYREGVIISQNSGFSVLPLFNACMMSLEVSLSVRNKDMSSAIASIDPEFIVLGPKSRTDVLVNRGSGDGGDLSIVVKCKGTSPPYLSTKYELPLKLEASKRRLRAPKGFVVDRPTMTFYNPEVLASLCRVRVLNATKNEAPFSVWIGRPDCPVEERKEKSSVFRITSAREGTIDSKEYLAIDVLFEGARNGFHYREELCIALNGRIDSIPLFGYAGSSDLRFECENDGMVRVENHGSRSGFIVVTGPDHSAIDNHIEKAVMAPGEVAEFSLPYGSGSEIYTGDEIARSRMCYAMEVCDMYEEGLFSGSFDGQVEAEQDEGYDWDKDGKHSLHYVGRLLDTSSRKYGINAEPRKIVLLSSDGIGEDKMWQASIDVDGYVHLENLNNVCDLEYEARGAEPGGGIVPPLGDAKLAAFNDSVTVSARGRTVTLSVLE